MNVTVPPQQKGPSPVMLSEAKHLAADRDRPFAEFTLERSEGLRVTRCDGSHCQVQFAQIEPCLNFLTWISEHPARADNGD